MPNRFWDKDDKFVQGFLKEFDHWVLELSFRQHTLGCFILFCKKPLEKISDLNQEELSNLAFAMKEMENLLLGLEGFKPDRFNYLQLGNVVNQLHFHGIPRYSSSRQFAGKEWIDVTWGKPPTWIFEHESPSTIGAIKKMILSELKVD